MLGPNGAGKSTLMKILSCYLSPSSGDARVGGFDILEQSMEVRKRIGYLPENNPLYPDLYVREFLQFMADIPHSTTKPLHHRSNRIREVIALTGLEAEQHKKIGALSRGYRQRIGLAQALLHDPEVLVLDEPTSGLDPNQLVEIRNLIRMIGYEKTIMLSTHIMQEVEATCDRTVIIHKGKIVADDKTRDLRHIRSPKTIVRVEFDQPVDPEKLRNLSGVLKAINPFPAIREQSSGTGHPPSLSSHPEQGSGIWHLESDPSLDIRPAVLNLPLTRA